MKVSDLKGPGPRAFNTVLRTSGLTPTWELTEYALGGPYLSGWYKYAEATDEQRDAIIEVKGMISQCNWMHPMGRACHVAREVLKGEALQAFLAEADDADVEPAALEEYLFAAVTGNVKHSTNSVSFSFIGGKPAGFNHWVDDLVLPKYLSEEAQFTQEVNESLHPFIARVMIQLMEYALLVSSLGVIREDKCIIVQNGAVKTLVQY